VFIVDVFKDSTQSSWVKECAPTKHPITEIWVKEFLNNPTNICVGLFIVVGLWKLK
jgi:hypothetical protein